VNCPACDFENPSAMKFCGQCGAALAGGCPSCGFRNPPGFRFCGECGATLRQTSPAEPPPERDLRAYTPKHLAERILSSKSAMEGEHKQVTVLFADVKGSLELSEHVNMEEWHRIMDRFFAILSEGVHRFEGTINQFTGDGIMALFGAPLAHEDHARRACYTALHLTEQLRRYSTDLRLSRGLNFSVRMGLNSGDVVVGKIGDDLRMDYTAQGATVGLASRMEQLAESGAVYLTEHTARLVEGYLQLERLGTFTVKGAENPLNVFLLKGLGPLRTRFDLSRARGFSAFVGRKDEMATLDAALQQAIEGNGQVIGVVAEPGTGKSRLCYEFAERCRAKGIIVRKTHGDAHGETIPFLPLFELLRAFFDISDRDTAQTARNKIAGVLLMLERKFDEVLPLVFEFLAVPDPDNPIADMSPEARKDQLFGVIRRLIQAVGERQPGVIIFEDLHWIDSSTEGFLASAVEAIPGTRTLLLVNFRPEYHADWMRKSYYHQIPLLPLGPQAVRELLEDLLGRDDSLARLSELIAAKTAGNPFFVEEVVQSLVEAGTLTGRRGDYRLGQPVEQLAIPATVHTVLAARIDRLGEQEKQLLQTASVIDRRITKGVLRQVAGLPESDLSAALHNLVATEFLNEKALYPEEKYTFKHPLTREVAYLSQLAEHRAHTHAQVAEAIERESAEKLDERAAVIAHHWGRANQPLQAARWYRRAAEWTGTGHAIESLAHWRKVQEMAGCVPDSAEADALGARACAMILFIRARIGALREDVEGLYHEASKLARRSQNDLLLAQLESSYWFYRYSSTGVVEDSLKPLIEAVTLADRSGDPGLRMLCRMNLYFCCGFGGRLERALAANAECLELSREDASVGEDLFGYVPRTAFVFARIWLLSWAGRVAECSPLLETIFEYTRNERDWVAQQTAHASGSMIAWTIGDAASALRHAREAVKLTGTPSANSILYTFNHHILARALLLGEEWAQAVEVLKETIGQLNERRIYRQVEGGCLSGLARAYSGLGELDKARTTAEEAVRIARANGWGFECDAELAHAHVLGRTAGAAATQEIEQALARASTLVEKSGARSRAPLILEGRAELAALSGDSPAREAALREAHRLYQEMGARLHALRIAAALEA
jgi:class 3 adenylate cyclase/tetratricopeptide (TPR) repeat protein